MPSPKIKNHILLRGSTYHVRLDVPSDIRAAFGNRRVLSKSLKTGDALLARELAGAQVAEWKAEFRQLKDQQIRRSDDWKESVAKSGEFYKWSRNRQILHAANGHPDFPNQRPRTPEEVEKILSGLKRLFEKVSAEQLAAGMSEQDIARYQELTRKKLLATGIDLIPLIQEQNTLSRQSVVLAAQQEYLLKPDELREARSLIAKPEAYRARSPLSSSLQSRFAEHFATQSDNERTRSVALSKIKAFSDWLTAEKLPLTFDSVAQYLDTLGTNRQTRTGHLWALRKVHKWACRYDKQYRKQFAASPSPFEQHSHPRVGKAAGGSWAVFTRKEAEQLYRAAQANGDTDLADLCAFACWTGCRIEELGRISTSTTIFENGTPVAFHIGVSKTRAGVREIPIATGLIPLYKQRLKLAASQGGYLFKGNNKTKSGIRLNALSQRFTKLKRAEGFGDKHVFHSFRKLTATELEQAGASALVIPAILGHLRAGGMTFTIYSAGPSRQQKREAIELLSFSFS